MEVTLIEEKKAVASQSLSQGLQELKLKVEDKQFKLKYGFNKGEEQHHSIFIGFGGKLHGRNKTIILDNKELYSGYCSVSELVYQSPASLVNSFEQMLENDVLEDWYFYVEDLSPDTCIAFILLYLRVSGVSLDHFPTEWLDYINRWEKGDVKTTGKPHQSFGSLLNALSHDFFDMNNKEMNIEQLNEGFHSCIHFTIELLLKECAPYNIQGTDAEHIEDYHKAKAMVENNYQEYLQVLNSAEKVQLMIPMKETSREVLVDGLIITEDHPLGVLKEFARVDKEHSWLGLGFAFLAVFRPKYEGTGYDITISVDPSTRLTLERLWDKLEEFENERWNGERPSSNPRFPNGKSKANQPWYDENGKYTIIGAPRRIEETGELGTKLTWEDVLQAIWECYSPASKLKITPLFGGGETCQIHDCQSVLGEKEDKKLLAVKWHSYGHQQALVLSPTINRYFAACINGEPRIDQLPPEASYDILPFPGGFSVIHRDGVLIFDDWTKDRSNVEEYKQEFKALLERYKAVKRLYRDIETELGRIQQFIVEPKKLRKQIITLNDRLSSYKLELRKTLLHTMLSSPDYHVKMFREHMEKRWGLTTQLEELYQAVAEIDTIVKTYVDTRTNQLINKITIYGFPIAVSSGLFSFIFEDLYNGKSIHYGMLSTFIGLTIGAIFWLHHSLK
ncbi:hypothetical protein ACUIJN_23665 [Metabacillus halosaccharovorans]|uniref:hypothetical protein n=1 Tax=Metabacillus halosaccharovorans TaxID=930124 RepID=UPI00403DAEC2